MSDQATEGIKCDKCGAAFKTQEELTAHEKESH